MTTEQAPLIQLRGVRKTYAQGDVVTEVLRGVDLALGPGITVVLGPSGSGKSTLLNLVGGLDSPSQGEVHVGGKNLGSLSPQELTDFRRTMVGFVFQGFNLLPTLTAEENVALGLEPLGVKLSRARQAARDALDQVGLGALAHKFPGQLSGGEQQRVAVARALCKTPTLLLADEPTGSLDRANADRMIALLAEVYARGGASQLVVTHDPRFATIAHRVITLENGVVAHMETRA